MDLSYFYCHTQQQHWNEFYVLQIRQLRCLKHKKFPQGYDDHSRYHFYLTNKLHYLRFHVSAMYVHISWRSNCLKHYKIIIPFLNNIRLIQRNHYLPIFFDMQWYLCTYVGSADKIIARHFQVYSRYQSFEFTATTLELY
jgi:hypothetical protein